MPRPLRVTPLGELVAVPERGAAYGNRGVLHADGERIVRGWQGRRWIACVLEFRGRRRPPMPPGGYTGLFFRDEATALAAGHRPCAECRRVDFDAFRDAWAGAFGAGRPDVATMDGALHAERVLPGARPAGGLAAARPLPPVDELDLPDGVVVADAAGATYVVVAGALRAWSLGALGPRADAAGALRLVTPRSTVAVLRAGYEPRLLPLVAGE